MSTAAEHWNAKHQTGRLTLLLNIYQPDGAIDLAECSRSEFDELPDQVQNEFHYTGWYVRSERTRRSR